MEPPPALIVPDGEDCHRATAPTTGPSSAQAQHGGPPAALLARAVERVGAVRGGRPCGWPSTSSGPDRSTTSSADVDLVVPLGRPPRGEWPATDAMHLAGTGTAQCFAALCDADGFAGRSSRSLPAEPR